MEDCCGGVNLPPELLQNVVHFVHHLLADGASGLDGLKAFQKLKGCVGTAQLPAHVQRLISEQVPTLGCSSCNTAVNLTGYRMHVIKGVQVAEPLLLGRQVILTTAAQNQDQILCHMPEGDIN